MVAHHHSVLKKQEVGASSELLDFSQGARRCSLCSNRDELREFELVFADIVGVLSIRARFSKRQIKGVVSIKIENRLKESHQNIKYLVIETLSSDNFHY